MNTPKAHSGIRHLLLMGILGTFILTGAVSVQAATYTNHSQLSFEWSEASGSVDHYNVYVSVNGQPFELLEQAGESACRLDAEDASTYVLQVEAENAAGRVGPMSDPSEPIVVFLNGTPDDTDGDGMSNDWETLYGLNPFAPNDADEDPDRDGSTNLDEFDDQTDPTDADSDDDGVADGEDPYPLDPLDGNSRPVADAGEDQELDPTVVTLDGSGSRDPDGDLLTYTWSQQEGPEVDLSDSHASRPSFLGTESGEYRFALVVHDGSLASIPDAVTVTIRNVAPAADAGEDREVLAGTETALDGSGSVDPNGDPVSFSWTQIAGVSVSLRGARNETATFTPETQGVYVFQLVTFDGHLYSPPDEVQVTVNTPSNSVPTADAGADRTVTVGDTVDLNGSGSSDPDGDALSYAWSQVEGPMPVALKGADTSQPHFKAPGPGLYEFQLVVNDGQVASLPDHVTVTVESPANQVPVAAIAELDSVHAGDWVTLDGTGSFDPDQDTLAYSWSQTGGPQVMLEDADQAMAGFYAVAEGTLTFELVVNDGDASSVPASVQVQVLPGEPSRAKPPAASPERQSDSGGGCSVGLGGGSQHEVNATDIGYLLTLFLPAIGALMYQKKRYRRGRRG